MLQTLAGPQLRATSSGFGEELVSGSGEEIVRRKNVVRQDRVESFIVDRCMSVYVTAWKLR